MRAVKFSNNYNYLPFLHPDRDHLWSLAPRLAPQSPVSDAEQPCSADEQVDRLSGQEAGCALMPTDRAS